MLFLRSPREKVQRNISYLAEHVARSLLRWRLEIIENISSFEDLKCCWYRPSSSIPELNRYWKWSVTPDYLYGCFYISNVIYRLTHITPNISSHGVVVYVPSPKQLAALNYGSPWFKGHTFRGEAPLQEQILSTLSYGFDSHLFSFAISDSLFVLVAFLPLPTYHALRQ